MIQLPYGNSLFEFQDNTVTDLIKITSEGAKNNTIHLKVLQVVVKLLCL